MVSIDDVAEPLAKIIEYSRKEEVPELNAEYLIGLSNTTDFVDDCGTFGITKDQAEQVREYLSDHYHEFLPDLWDRYDLDEERQDFLYFVNCHRRMQGRRAITAPGPEEE